MLIDSGDGRYAAIVMDVPSSEDLWMAHSIIFANHRPDRARPTLADLAATRHTLTLLLSGMQERETPGAGIDLPGARTRLHRPHRISPCWRFQDELAATLVGAADRGRPSVPPGVHTGPQQTRASPAGDPRSDDLPSGIRAADWDALSRDVGSSLES